MHNWLPRSGPPLGVFDRISQRLVRLIAFIPIYIGLVVIITLLVWRRP